MPPGPPPVADLAAELDRRADAAEALPPAPRPARTWRPSSGHGWTPAGVVTVLAAATALGTSVLIPLLRPTPATATDQASTDARATVQAREQAALGERVTSAAAACGSALSKAEAAEGHARAAELLAGQALKASGRKPARPPPAPAP